MTIQLDHFIVACRDQVASASLLGGLLAVPWEETTLGGFSPVYLNEGLTLDFEQTDEDFPIAHYCFRVSQQEFDTILGRIQAAGIRYRSSFAGPFDMQVNKGYGGDMIYWNAPDGHQWEMLTVSYARKPP
jgi:catechol 2,3-dioxygenase-like lactoylglutathione lyase family enzyme